MKLGEILIVTKYSNIAVATARGHALFAFKAMGYFLATIKDIAVQEICIELHALFSKSLYALVCTSLVPRLLSAWARKRVHIFHRKTVFSSNPS